LSQRFCVGESLLLWTGHIKGWVWGFKEFKRDEVYYWASQRVD